MALAIEIVQVDTKKIAGKREMPVFGKVDEDKIGIVGCEVREIEIEVPVYEIREKELI